LPNQLRDRIRGLLAKRMTGLSTSEKNIRVKQYTL